MPDYHYKNNHHDHHSYSSNNGKHTISLSSSKQKKPKTKRRQNSSHRRRGKKNYVSCFNILLILVFFQTMALIALGLFSNQLRLEDWSKEHGPLMENLYNFGYDVLFEGRFWTSIFTGDDDLVQMEDQMVHETEQKLMFDDADKNNPVPKQQLIIEDDDYDTFDPSSTKPLDNYFSRKRMPMNRKPIIVVGGTDGSGTRAFVPVLGKLGVPMIVDDQDTMDVHGKKMFNQDGWPPLANMVLNATHSANYNFTNLPPHVQSTSLEELGKLKRSMEQRYQRLLDRAKDQHMPLATSVSYGFKAPITMVLLPLLQQVYGPIKYVHVVRDGRDVALSSNQSPVQKYYESSYADSEQREKKLKEWFKAANKNETTAQKEKEDEPKDDTIQKKKKRNNDVIAMNVQAMQLWNDWNMDVLKYVRQNANGKDLSYIVVRTEDLLHPRKKFEALYQLGEFIGSPKTLKEICCMSQTALADMGRSANMGQQQGPGHGGFGGGFPGRLRRGGRGELPPRDADGGGIGKFFQDFGMIRAFKQTAGESEQRLKRFMKKHQNHPMNHQEQSDEENPSSRTTASDRYEEIKSIRDERMRKIAQRVGRNVRQHNEKRNFRQDNRRRLDDSGATDFIVNNGLWKNKQRRIPNMRPKPPQRHEREEEEEVMEEESESNMKRKRGQFRQANLDAIHESNRMVVSNDDHKDNKANAGHHRGQGRHHRNIKEIAQRVHDGWVNRGDRMFDGGGGSGNDDGRNPQQYNQYKQNLQGKRKKNQVGGGGGDGTKRSDHHNVGKRSNHNRRHNRRRDRREIIEPHQAVEKRYGKWMTVLQGKPHILKKFEQEGMEALKEFGYEPKQRFMDYKELDYQCDDTVLCEAASNKR